LLSRASGLSGQAGFRSGSRVRERVTGTEFEVEVKPRRGPGGADLDDSVTDYAGPPAGESGPEGP